MEQLRSVEMCAGAGGQALGLEQAGFTHIACVEIDAHACETLRLNRPTWNVLEADMRSEAILQRARTEWTGVELLAGGVPCPPFSVAGKQLGQDDERDLFPAMLDLVAASQPRAVLIENVRGLLNPIFADYRKKIVERLAELGYVHMGWQLVNASNFGVPQLRPRVAMVAVRPEDAPSFSWPEPSADPAPTVGEALYDQISSNGWRGAEAWKRQANDIAPTIVGGSKKHGGPDLGPTRAKAQWAKMGVDAMSIAAEAPEPEFEGKPRLTVAMAATLQGFPPEWLIAGKKTQAYRQVGNAFPPPVARAIGEAIKTALTTRSELKATA